MYHSYFGLTEQPFSIAVDPRYLFMSARHRDALAHLLYGVGEGGGFILLTGPVGTGKTTITRSLLEQLPKNTDLALVLNPSLNAIELLATICDELNIQYQKDEQRLKPLTDKIHQYLLENFSAGKNTVLLIDEAQHLQFDTLEQIRLLTNLETNTKKLLQIILVGQPELKTLLNKPELSQLAQRITARYQLTPLDLDETKSYIHHRLHIAGLPSSQQLFPEKIIKTIFSTSKGIPRVINVLCDRMLLGCYGQNKSHIDKTIAQQAIKEIKEEEPSSFHQSISKTISVKSLSLVTIIAFAIFAIILGSAPSGPLQNLISPTTASNTATPDTFSFDSKQEAITSMAKYLGKFNNGTICNIDFRCENLTAKSWQDLEKFQRPATLKLKEGMKESYVNFLEINNNTVSLINKQKPFDISRSEIEKKWHGEFTLIWQAPQDYDGPIKLGDTGPMINWLAQQFSKLDQQPTSLADNTFNANLYQRVIIFQKENNLTADGVVGLKTLLKLEQQLNANEPLKESI